MTQAIRVDRLSKCYRIAGKREQASYKTFRETLADAALAPIRRLRKGRAINGTQPFWALRDVSLQIQPGEAVGIIGRNGAGKSTLLKIISRITRPTRGRVELHGRIGSLLEIGTGFHPELTGRENIYLNGSILGMKRREIDQKLDDIVAFSETEQFLDTPVKRYSSGMQVRLAFAVAAHLEPEILVVDEVLAVGDATYQRRCIERMERLARLGITILFVSHNLELIPRLCQKAVLLRDGQVEVMGEAGQVTKQYVKSLEQLGNGSDLATRSHLGDGRARFCDLTMIGSDGQPTTNHVSGEDMVLRMQIDAREPISDVALAVVLQNMYGTRLITSWTKEVGYHLDLSKGKQAIQCRFRQVRLRPGHRLRVSLWMAGPDVIDWVEDAAIIEVVASGSSRNFSTDQAQGIVLCQYDWSRDGPA